MVAMTTEDLLGLHVIDGVAQFWAQNVPDDDKKDPFDDDDEEDRGSTLVRIVRIDGISYAFWSAPTVVAIARDDHPRRDPAPWPFGQVYGAHRILDFSSDPFVCNFVRRPSVVKDEKKEDVLCAIDERTGLLVLEVGTEWQDGPPTPGRVIMPMNSGVNILPGTSAQITARSQTGAFRPDRIIIGLNPGDWIVNDIRIGNRSQFSQAGDVPGELFAENAFASVIHMETASAAMDIVMIVTYVGNHPIGSPFVCVILGESTDAGPRRVQRFVWRWTPEGRMRGFMRGDEGLAALAYVEVGSALTPVL